jgi:hypothetical protein
MGKKGRESSTVWVHFKTVKDPETNKPVESTCNYCNYTVNWPKVERLIDHLEKCRPEVADDGNGEDGDGGT